MWSDLRASLRLRLALAFVGGSLGTLVVVSGFLYWGFQREINLRNRTHLDASLQELGVFLGQHPGDSAALHDEVVGEGASTEPRTLLRVLAGTRLLVETPGMGQQLPPARFPGPGWAADGKRKFLLAQRQVGGNTLQGALDISADERLVSSYRQRLVLALLAGAGLCAFLGWWAAHRGLAPLGALAESTRSINAERLCDRLNPGLVPQELRDLVRALNEMLDRLDAAFSRLSRFSADLAHELRTPITNLMGEAEVTLAQERPVEEYRQVLESGLEECRRLSVLITRMLFLARAEDPAAAVVKVPLDAKRLVDDVLSFFEACAEEQGITLAREVSAGLDGDAGLLRQALVNLMANGLNATAPGGVIQVAVRPEGAWTLLAVSDTGRGIPAEEIPLLTERFFRTREALGRHGGGTGLGLAIVRSIARLHGGEVGIESRVGTGTTVTLRLPRAG